MMKTSLVFVMALLCIAHAFGQPVPDTLWTRSYGGTWIDEGQSICQTADGGYAVAGYTGSFGSGNADFWLIKLDAEGNATWSRTYGGTSGDACMVVKQTSDSGYILAGYTYSFGAANSDFWIVKTNAQGDSLWSRMYGGTYSEICMDVVEINDGYAFAGYTQTDGSGNYDFWLIRTDTVGQSIWNRTYGGYATEVCYSIQQTTDGGFVLGGYTTSFGQGNQDFWVVKVNSIGNEVWSRTYGGYDYDVCTTVTQTADGGYALAGYTQSFSAGGMDALLIKTNSQGDDLWRRNYGGSGHDYCRDIHQTADDGYIMAGYTSSFGPGGSDIWLVKTDVQGNEVWSHTYGGSGTEECTSVQATPDGGYIAAGFTNSFGAGMDDFYVVKTGVDPQLRGVRVLSPGGGDQWHIFEQDTATWTGYGFPGLVRIELNRNYPTGAWEVLRDSTANDGIEAVYVTDPLSTHCRVRVSAIGDTLSDISDGDFSITASQGYLALVRTSAPSSPVLSWNAGSIECPQIGEENFRLKNFGSEAIVVFQPLEPLSSEFSRTTSCGTFLALSPGQMSACSLRLGFDPGSDGTFRDTLLVQTDAVNGVGGYVRIPLSGMQISTPAVPQIVIQPQGEDIHLAWQPITQSVGGCPVNVTRYLVFYAPNQAGPYYYHGYTSGTAYTHIGAVSYASGMFYQVIARTGETSVLEEIPGNGVLTMGEVMEALK